MDKQLNSRWTWAAIVVALALGVGAGRLAMLGKSTQEAPTVAAPTPTPSAKTAAPTLKPDEPGITRYQVPVTISQPAKGPADALVTIVGWCDLQSVACRDADAVLTQVLAAYDQELRFVFRHLPQETLESQLAHEFAQIAHERADKFWTVRERLLHAAGPIELETVERIAKEVDMDWPATLSALESHSFAQHVGTDAMFAKFFEVTKAPAFFVNGRRLEGKPSLAAFRTLIDDELKHAETLVSKGIARDAVYANLIRGGKWKRPSEMDAPAN